MRTQECDRWAEKLTTNSKMFFLGAVLGPRATHVARYEVTCARSSAEAVGRRLPTLRSVLLMIWAGVGRAIVTVYNLPKAQLSSVRGKLG
jgi:hypothetical protein